MTNSTSAAEAKPKNIPSDAVVCVRCLGSGRQAPTSYDVPRKPCPKCKGEGWCAAKRTIFLHAPNGNNGALCTGHIDARAEPWRFARAPSLVTCGTCLEVGKRNDFQRTAVKVGFDLVEQRQAKPATRDDVDRLRTAWGAR